MAKIGNEARLILKLAEERVKGQWEEARVRGRGPETGSESAFYRGKAVGLEAYKAVIDNIVLEMEAR